MMNDAHAIYSVGVCTSGRSGRAILKDAGMNLPRSLLPSGGRFLSRVDPIVVIIEITLTDRMRRM